MPSPRGRDIAPTDKRRRRMFLARGDEPLNQICIIDETDYLSAVRSALGGQGTCLSRIARSARRGFAEDPGQGVPVGGEDKENSRDDWDALTPEERTEAHETFFQAFEAYSLSSSVRLQRGLGRFAFLRPRRPVPPWSIAGRCQG